MISGGQPYACRPGRLAHFHARGHFKRAPTCSCGILRKQARRAGKRHSRRNNARDAETHDDSSIHRFGPTPLCDSFDSQQVTLHFPLFANVAFGGTATLGRLLTLRWCACFGIIGRCRRVIACGPGRVLTCAGAWKRSSVLKPSPLALRVSFSSVVRTPPPPRIPRLGRRLPSRLTRIQAVRQVPRELLGRPLVDRGCACLAGLLDQ